MNAVAIYSIVSSNRPKYRGTTILKVPSRPTLHTVAYTVANCMCDLRGTFTRRSLLALAFSFQMLSSSTAITRTACAVLFLDLRSFHLELSHCSILGHPIQLYTNTRYCMRCFFILRFLALLTWRVNLRVGDDVG